MPRLKESELRELIKITPDQIEKLDYETAMQRLEVVVEALEQEGTPLELGLRLYELGMTLSRKCGSVLDATEEKMVPLLGEVNIVRSPLTRKKMKMKDFAPLKNFLGVCRKGNRALEPGCHRLNRR